MELKKIIIFMLMILVGIESVLAAASLNVVLSNQNPDPVTPGNYVYVNIKVSNLGDESVENAIISFVENANFQIAQGSELTKNLGIIPAYSGREGSSSFVIAKYKILVDEDTPLGLNTLKFEVDTPRGEFIYEFDVLVEDANPNIAVNTFNIETLSPGDSKKLTIELENKNSVDLKDIIVELNLQEVESNAFSTKSGSNQKIIPLLRAGEKQTLEFDLVASPDATAKPYLLPVDIMFEDSQGNNYTHQVLGSIQIYSEPKISLTVDSQEIYSKGTGRITLAIANPGTSSIKGTRVEILSSEKYEVIEGKYQYLGDLNPDDFQTIQSDINIESTEDVVLKVKLTYLDSYNNEQEKTIELPLQVYNQEELNRLGLPGQTQGAGIGTYIVGLLLILAAFIIGRKLGYKKGKKSRK